MHEEYTSQGTVSKRSLRDEDSLKAKFNKLYNTKKSTGDPTFPPNVRRAKHIAKAVLSCAAAASLGGGAYSSSFSDSVIDLTEHNKPSNGGDGGGTSG